MKKILAILLALVATTSLWAYDFKQGYLYYNVIDEKKSHVEVGGMSERNENSQYITHITVPATVKMYGKTYTVVGIDDDAFRDRSSLKSVTIPEGVTSVGEKAFSGCKSLKSVIIPNSVTSIGKLAFSNCSSLTSITIPEGVTSIGFGAFLGCSSLTAVTIPNSVKSIGGSAFSGCKSLKSVTIQEGVKSIGARAFCDCLELQTINYLGTKKQWKGIEDTNLTIRPKKQIVVHCTDGKLKLKGK